MNRTCILLIVILSAYGRIFSQYAASNFTLISHIDPETIISPQGDKYSGCWGWYQAGKNKEYAIACSNMGTYWVDVTNPATPTVSAYRAGLHTGCTWREVKTYQNYCYVISDDPGNNSFQIFDMQYLPDSVSKVYDSKALFQRGHTLWVDGNKLYVAAVTTSNNVFSSMNVYSLTNPVSPVLIRRLDQDYGFITGVHDMYVRNDTVYASCAYQGMYVFKLTAAGTFTQLGSLTSYPFSGYNHSSALTPDGQTLVFLDEIPTGMPIKVADVTNLGNIQVLATTNQFPQTTPHNPFIVNNQYCFVSSYQDGLQLFDISNPAAPFLAGYFDTYPQAGGNNNTWPANADYNGQWGSYPFLPSRNIFALDQSNGVFMLKTALYQHLAVSAGFSASSTTICVGATLNVVSTGSGAATYSWNFQGGTPAASNATSAAVSFSTAGIYTVSLLAANPGYSAMATQTITVVNNTITAAISSTNSSCATCSTGIISVNPLGGINPYTYTWFPQGGNSSTAANLAPGCYTVTIKDLAGCKSTTSTCISFFTGLRNASADPSALLLYPNPAQTILHIDYPGSSFSYRIFDHTGRLLTGAQNSPGKAVLQLDGFSAGMYIIEVETENNKIRKKIVIER